jgi:hypothetical protein
MNQRDRILAAIKELQEERGKFGDLTSIDILYRIRRAYPGYPWPALLNHLFKMVGQGKIETKQYFNCKVYYTPDFEPRWNG